MKTHETMKRTREHERHFGLSVLFQGKGKDSWLKEHSSPWLQGIAQREAWNVSR